MKKEQLKQIELRIAELERRIALLEARGPYTQPLPWWPDVGPTCGTEYTFGAPEPREDLYEK